MEPKSEQKSVSIAEADFSKNSSFPLRNFYIRVKMELAKIDQKSLEDRSKMTPKKGWQSELDFGSILVDFWGQVGSKNALEMEPKTGWKPWQQQAAVGSTTSWQKMRLPEAPEIPRRSLTRFNRVGRAPVRPPGGDNRGG